MTLSRPHVNKLIIPEKFCVFDHFSLTFPDEACTIEATGHPGECMFMSDCPVVLAEYTKLKKMPTLCDRKYRTVCCPMKMTTTTTTTTQAPKRVSERSKKINKFMTRKMLRQKSFRMPRVRSIYLRDDFGN